MAKVAAYVKSFNAGEFSVLLDGRTDIDRYPASLRHCVNFVPAPQGPLLRRSGTRLQVPVYDETKTSALVPFIFAEDQIKAIEIAEGKIRFHDEPGVQAQTPVPITTTFAVATVKYNAPGHGAVVGGHVVLGGFIASTNLTDRVGRVTAVLGDTITTDITTPASYGSLATATSATVYEVGSPYLAVDVENIRYLQDQDTLYLFCDGYAPRKLSRFSAYDWRLIEVDFIDGPFDSTNDTTTRLKPNATGNAVPHMTANNVPAPWVASASSEAATHEAFKAFNNNAFDYWEASSNQTGTLTIKFDVPSIVDGYVIEMASVNADTNYKSLDYAPGDWEFQGSDDGVTYITLDAQLGYVLYDNNRSVLFPVKNDHAYAYYQLAITKVTRNGPLVPRVRRLSLTTREAAGTRLTASSIVGINGDTGFQTTDVGRLVRFKCTDGMWRSLKITSRASPLIVFADLQKDVLFTADDTTNWRLGLFSDTTGWPTAAGWFEDRLWIGGMSGYPDWFAFSVTGKYEVFSPTTISGDVEDDNGFAGKLQARRRGRLAWIATDGRVVLLGTSSAIWSVSSTDQQSAISARTAKARRQSARGAAPVEPQQVDRQILFVQRGFRSMREAIFSFGIDGYETPSMSLYASHIGALEMKQHDFAYEPYSIDWVRMGDGTVAGFVYNKEQSVLGWFRCDFGGFVESLCVLPSQTTNQDVLWMTIRRETAAGTRRFVERMLPLWDFGNVVTDAHFVDGGLTYSGAPITDVYGLWMYEGMRVVGLADGSPITPTIVVNGRITLPVAASVIVIGLGFDSEAETSRLEAGSANGTAQGKWKRIHEMRMRLWDTGGGAYATRNSDGTVSDYIDLESLTPDTEMDEALPLFSGDTKPLDMPQNYSLEGTLLLRQSGDIPLPLNVVALMPQLVTQDGG